MPKEQKHHYIPSFYLKRWAGADRRLIEYRLGYENRIFRRWTFPDGTGYLRGLNTIAGLPPELANVIEDQFLQRADDLACKALDQFLTGNVDVEPKLRHGWTRFIISLFHRNPERIKYLKAAVDTQYKGTIEKLRAEYDAQRRPTDPATFEEYQRTVNPLGRAYAAFFQDIVDSTNVGEVINRMEWGFLTLHKVRFPLITSDRPMAMTNGIGTPNAHIVMPISPNKIFIAARTMSLIDQISAMADRGELLTTLNDRLVRQARKYVYASQPLELRYLEKRFGQKVMWSPLKEARD